MLLAILGCLTINTIKQFGDIDITLYSLSKLALYRRAYEAWILPDTWYIFIWQKKNMRQISSSENKELFWWNEKIVHYDAIDWWDNAYFIDPCEHLCIEKLERKYMLDIWFDGEQIHVWYNGAIYVTDKDLLWLEVLDSVDPLYCMEPQIG